LSAQLYDRIVYDGKEYGLAAAPLEAYFAANPTLRPKFIGFNSACTRGYTARWEFRDGGRLYLVGMDMVCKTDATFDSLFPDGKDGVFAEWVSKELVCPYGALVKYDHAGFARKQEHELLLSVKNGVLESAKVRDNAPPQKNA
jgi:hypothetical protein